VRGFVAGAQDLLSAAEVDHLAVAGQVIAYEIGVRFLADHLDGDVYFRVHRAGHNLDRARTQFALLRSLQRQEDSLRTIASRAAGETEGGLWA